MDKELLNFKDVIIKDLQVENQRLCMKVNSLENKVMSLEINDNHLEQHRRRNNLGITGIPDDVSDENLEEKVIQVLSEIQVNVSSSDVEACHRIGKSKNSPKKALARFINRKHTKKALINRKGLININKSSRSLSSSDKIFINENLTPMNNQLPSIVGSLNVMVRFYKTYSRDDVIHIVSSNIRDGIVIKMLHMSMLIDIFPDFDFGPDAREEERNESLQSSY